jgi:hypothetical protein
MNEFVPGSDSEARPASRNTPASAGVIFASPP